MGVGYFFFFLIDGTLLFFSFLHVKYAMQIHRDLVLPSRDGSRVPCSGSTES